MANLFNRVFKKSPAQAEVLPQESANTITTDNAAGMQLIPTSIDQIADLQGYRKISLTELAAAGTAFASLATPFRTVSQQINIPTDGIYRVHMKQGSKLMKSGDHFLGSIKGEKGIAAQARWEKLDSLTGNMNITLPYDPTLVVLAIAMHEINQRFDEIKEIGLEILGFLEQDKEAQLRSDLAYLQDVLANYSHNCTNEKFKTNQHIKVLDIKKDALDKIEFYHDRIKKQNDKQLGPIHASRDVNDRHKTIQKEFKNYQLALYIYAFATFLEVMLLENFETGYVNNKIDDIRHRAHNYNRLYETCSVKIENQARSAVENQLIGGVGTTIRAVGKAIAKIPVVSNSQVDETLIATGHSLLRYRDQKSRETAERLEVVQDNMIHPFIENLYTVERLNNKPLDILYDQNCIYVRSLSPN